MKIWFITLSLLFAADFAQADDMMYGPAATQAEAQSTPARMESRSRQKAYKHRHGRLPKGDLRHCLGLDTNEAIIRCAEGRRSR